MLAASKAPTGRQTCSLSLEREVIQELQETRGSGSTSERANQLLRAALEAEKLARLEDEAREFYVSDDRSMNGSINGAKTGTKAGTTKSSARDREEVRAFRSGAMKSWNRE